MELNDVITNSQNKCSYVFKIQRVYCKYSYKQKNNWRLLFRAVSCFARRNVTRISVKRALAIERSENAREEF